MASEEYWENLLGPTEAATATGGIGKSLKGFLGKKGIKAGLGGAALWLALSKILGTINQQQEFGIQKEAIRGQAQMATPENLFYQAALPQAQQEESMARQALFTQLSGGVLGPTLARGEKLIGR